MKLKKITILTLIFILILTPGCWNRSELNELGIVTALGVDIALKEDEISFVYQIVNPSAMIGKGVSGSMTPFITITTSGKTEFFAIKKSARELSRKLYFAHIQIIVISSKMAKKKGVKDLLDLLYRDHEIRENIPIIIAKDQTADMILSQQSVLEINSGISTQKHLENTFKNNGSARPIELRELINTLTSPTSSAVLPTVHLSPPKPQSSLEATQKSSQEVVIKTEGSAVFKNDKLVGYINSEETRGYNCATDNLEGGVIVVPYKDGLTSMEIITSKTEIKTKVIHGKPEVQLNIKLNVNIGEVNVPIELTKLKTIEELESATNKEVNKSITDIIEKMQKEYKLDIFQFGEAFRRKHPKEWKKLEKDWKKEFSDLTVKVKVNTTIVEIGMKNNPFQLEMKGNK